jgi:hypothetical protein
MRVFIDISLLTAASAVGRVSGAIEFPVLPRVGELVSLARGVVPSAGFSGQLAVEHVIHSPTESNQQPMLSLADVTLQNREAAIAVGKALELSYGLFFEPYRV